MFTPQRPFLIVGFILIALGVILVLLQFVLEFAPRLERLGKLGKLVIYVYRRNNFYFITSPLLILIGLAYLTYLLWGASAGNV